MQWTLGRDLLASLILVVLKTNNTKKHFKCIPHTFLQSPWLCCTDVRAMNIHSRNSTQQYYLFFPRATFQSYKENENTIAPMSWAFYFWPIGPLWHEKDNMKVMTQDTKFSSLSCLATIKFCMIFNSVSLIFWMLRLNYLVKEQQVLETAADV